MSDGYAALRNVKAKHRDDDDYGEGINPEEPPRDERSKEMFGPLLILAFQRLHQHECGVYEEQIHAECTKRREDIDPVEVKTSHMAGNHQKHGQASEEVQVGIFNLHDNTIIWRS